MSTRRAFFLQGSAALGAGVATAVGASPPTEQLADLQDREAIRSLHLAFLTLLEEQDYDAATKLFAAQRNWGQQGGVIHNAYRHRSDTITLSEDRQHATATFHVDVELCTPLTDDCTIAQMARLQGMVADRRWETGRFEAQYVKTAGQWKIASLDYRA